MTLVRRVWWVLAALLVLGSITPSVPARAQAAAVQARLAAPQGEYAGTLRFEIDSITPALVTDTDSTVTISGRMINTGSEELTGVVARWQRGPAFDSTAAVQAEIDEPGQPESVLTAFSPVTDTIAAGGTAPFTLQTDAFRRPRSGLGIQAPGVYPIMVNVNAAFTSGPDGGARVGELHALLTVASVPDGTAVVGTRQAVSMVMPLVDRPHRDPTGAFFDDDLAPLISSGGRLDDVLSAAEVSGLPAGAVTLAVDPELLEELRLMSTGYTVGPAVFDIAGASSTGTATSDTATSDPVTTSSDVPTTDAPPGPPPVGTDDGTSDNGPTTGATSPDATTDPTTTAPTTTAPAPTTTAPTPSSAASTDAAPTTGTGAGTFQPAPSGVTGTGTAAAGAFLERLRELATTTPVLVLPYTDIDAVAAVRAGGPELVTAAVDRGRTLAADILGPQARLIENVSWPIDGLVDPATLSVLRSSGMTGALLDPAGVTGDDGSRATLDTDAGTVAAVLASDLPAGPVDLNRFTALTGQRWLSGDTAATVIAPARTWNPELDEYDSVTGLLQTLAGTGLVDGVPVVGVVAQPATTTAGLDYPEAAVGRELPTGLFDRVRDLAQSLITTQQTFDVQATDDPSTIAPTDLFATVRDGLSRQAAGGFRADLGAAARSDAAVGRVVTTVQSGVSITPSATVYTLTSATSPLLVTIRNDLPYAAHVRVRVDPDDARRAGMSVTDAGVQTLPAFRSSLVRLEAETIKPGLSTIDISLTSPDGTPWGQAQTFTFRSTAIGSFTVVLIIAAAAVVVLTTAIRIRKRYRQRRDRIAAGLQ